MGGRIGRPVTFARHDERHHLRATRQNVYGLDWTAWNTTFKERRYEGRTKVEQSVANIRREQALVEPIRLENGDCVYANADGQIALPV